MRESMVKDVINAGRLKKARSIATSRAITRGKEPSNTCNVPVRIQAVTFLFGGSPAEASKPAKAKRPPAASSGVVSCSFISVVYA